MADFLVDSFTDTAGNPLTGHAPGTGGTWTQQSGATFAFSGTSPSGTRVYTSTNEYMYNTASPASADYEVEAVMYHHANDNTIMGVAGRIHVGDLVRYELNVNNQTNQLMLVLRDAVGSSPTTLGTYAITLVDATNYTVKLTMVGTTIKGFWENVEVISVTDATISAAGKAGIQSPQADGSLIQMDSIRAGPVSAAAATGTTLTGPASGTVGVASTNFTAGVTPEGGAITGTLVVTPDDNSGGGSFSPTSLNLTTGSPTGTFTYTAASAGVKSIGITDNGGLTDPADVSYTALPAPVLMGQACL